MIRSIARCAFVATGGALLALAVAAGPLHADPGGPGSDSWSRLLTYAGCALGIVAATNPFGIGAAVLACVKIFVLDA